MWSWRSGNWRPVRKGCERFHGDLRQSEAGNTLQTSGRAADQTHTPPRMSSSRNARLQWAKLTRKSGHHRQSGETDRKHAQSPRDCRDVTDVHDPDCDSHREVPPTGLAQQMAFETWRCRGLYAHRIGGVRDDGGTDSGECTEIPASRQRLPRGRRWRRPKGAPPALVSPPGGNTTSRPWSPSGGASTGTGAGRSSSDGTLRRHHVTCSRIGRRADHGGEVSRAGL